MTSQGTSDNPSSASDSDVSSRKLKDPPSCDQEATIPPQSDLDSTAAGNWRRCGSVVPMPTELDDYRILGEIARGGMGIVYRAHQISLDREVALKTVLDGRFESPAALEQFRSEAQSAGQLKHPGIVPVYEFGEWNGRQYFSMPLIEGCSLSERIAQGPLAPDEAARIMKATAETIQFAHDHQVVHRDLKPGNILLDQDGSPLVTDFGIAARMGEGSLPAAGQPLPGTAEYMAPEQASGQQAGPTSDVYSLGATFYCLLTGRPPFQSSSVQDTLIAVLEKAPVPPRQLNHRIPTDLELICLKCLEKAAERRYQSAQELADELDRFLRGNPVLVHPVGNVGTFLRWTRRQPRMAAMAAGLVVCYSAALGISVYFNYRLKLEREAARILQFEAEENEARARRHQRITLDLLQELANTRDNLNDALEYSTLGTVCDAAVSLTHDGRFRNRSEKRNAFQDAFTMLTENHRNRLQPLVDQLLKSADSDTDFDQLTEAVDALVQEIRSIWQTNTADAPEVRHQIRSVLYARCSALVEHMLKADRHKDAHRAIASLIGLLQSEVCVVAGEKVFHSGSQLRTQLLNWQHGPATIIVHMTAREMTVQMAVELASQP